MLCAVLREAKMHTKYVISKKECHDDFIPRQRA